MAFGRIDPSRGSPPLSDINVTPLVDVMLVLLVIFILTAPLMASSIRLDLPSTEAAQASQPIHLIALSIDREGRVFLGDEAVGLDELAVRLSGPARANPATEVQLRADRVVPYGRVVEVMGVAQKAGLSRIAFMAEPVSQTFRR